MPSTAVCISGCRQRAVRRSCQVLLCMRAGGWLAGWLACMQALDWHGATTAGGGWGKRCTPLAAHLMEPLHIAHGVVCRSTGREAREGASHGRQQPKGDSGAAQIRLGGIPGAWKLEPNGGRTAWCVISMSAAATTQHSKNKRLPHAPGPSPFHTVCLPLATATRRGAGRRCRQATPAGLASACKSTGRADGGQGGLGGRHETCGGWSATAPALALQALPQALPGA